MPEQTLRLMVHPSWLINQNRKEHWAPRAKKTRNLRALAHTEARAQGLKPVAVRQRVTITYGFLTLTRRDGHNWAGTSKAIVDGLTDFGVWPDDDSVWVEGPLEVVGALSPDVHDRPRPLRRVQILIHMEDAGTLHRRLAQAAAMQDLADGAA